MYLRIFLTVELEEIGQLLFKLMFDNKKFKTIHKQHWVHFTPSNFDIFKFKFVSITNVLQA